MMHDARTMHHARAEFNLERQYPKKETSDSFALDDIVSRIA